jgi:hypothetical protein
MVSEGFPIFQVFYLMNQITFYLCDKHHRLIDKVAAADYSASTLALMRKEFCDLAENL